MNFEYIEQTDSTNRLIKERLQSEKPEEGFLLYTDFQTAGKGQAGNSWESEAGKNLLFSLLLYPHHIKITQYFLISQITSLAIYNILSEYSDETSIKWPNDIYWREKKIGGILIENSLFRDQIRHSIIGVGLNINQEKFFSDAPNPVSLKQITGKEQNRDDILRKLHSELLRIYKEFSAEEIQRLYHQNLYRKEGFHPYTDSESGEQFSAKIRAVEQDGRLILEDKAGEIREFYFKEVVFG